MYPVFFLNLFFFPEKVQMTSGGVHAPGVAVASQQEEQRATPEKLLKEATQKWEGWRVEDASLWAGINI